MLVIRCANGWVVWVFRDVDRTHREAICGNDKVALQYNKSADASWGLLVRDMLTHAIALSGAFQDMWWLPL